jgi:hypothetical protein
VIVSGAVALKFARNANGRACNSYEADLYRNTTPHRRAMLCNKLPLRLPPLRFVA